MSATGQTEMLVRQEPPNESWELWSIRILGSSDNLKEALKKERLAQTSSDLGTEAEDGPKRSRLKPKWLLDSSSDDDEEDLPSCSKIIKKRKNIQTESCSFNRQSSSQCKSMSPIFKQPGSGLRSSPKHSSSIEARDVHLSKIQSQIDSIERVVLQIKIDVSNILEILQQKSSQQSDEQLILDNLIEVEDMFPMRTMDDVLLLERKLSDNDFMMKMKEYLRQVGGTSVEDNTRRILVKLYTNELAREFSWEGRGGKKRSLQDLNHIELIGRVIRSGPHKNNFSLKIFEKKVSEWFRQSGTRIYVKNRKLKDL